MEQATSSKPAGNGLASLQRLEERVLHTVEDLKEARRQRAEAAEEADRMRSLLAEKDKEIGRLAQEVSELQSERESVRERIEALLARIEHWEG